MINLSLKIEKFCKLIGDEYSYFLYENEEDYPFCCHTSANLLSSYLSVHFDKGVTHEKLPAHGCSMGKDYIVDFTYFQFSLNDKEKKFFKRESLCIQKIIYIKW